MSKLFLLVRIALRNLFASKMNLIIGGLIFVGTLVIVVGGGLLGSVENAMSRSVTASVAGDLQIYSAKAKDALALFGNFGGDADVGVMEDFDKIKSRLEKLPEVKSVVPMGVSGALVTSGNTIDVALAQLREAYDALPGGKEGKPNVSAATAEQRKNIDSLKAHVQQMIRVLQQDAKNAKEISAAPVDKDAAAALTQVAAPEFWSNFDNDPFGSLELLENRVAPQMADADMLYLRYVGTDLDDFQKSFDRMEIVDGTAVPQGHRGMLLAKNFYEDQVKLKSARRLDKIHEALSVRGQKIAQQPDLKRMIEDNQTQTREIIFQLDSLRTQSMVERLQKELKSNASDLGTLLVQFFKMDDSNFEQRYQFFYDQVAPLLELYRIRVGDMLTIKAFTRSGYQKAVNVKVYGTFNFKGLEKSPLSGALNLMDLISFRELYGYLTADKVQELESLKKQAGATTISRDQAEDALFGGGAGEGSKTVVADATPGLIDESKEFSGTAKALRTEDLIRRVYSKDEMDKGVVLNAAVILKDPNRSHEMIARINQLSREEGLEIKAVSWQDAAGLFGQMISSFKAGLFAGVFVIFIVTLVVINNAMMMATLQRIREIGTLRAIGAQGTFVLAMVLVETLCLSIVFGGTGVAAGSAIMGLLHRSGIKAVSDPMYVLFAGPRLNPTLSVGTLVVAFVVILLVSAISTLYPAVVATRVSPLQAMQTEE